MLHWAGERTDSERLSKLTEITQLVIAESLVMLCSVDLSPHVCQECQHGMNRVSPGELVQCLPAAPGLRAPVVT